METVLVAAVVIVVVSVAASVRSLLVDGYHRVPTLSRKGRIH